MLELNYNQAAQLAQDAIDGNEDPLKAFGLLKRLQEAEKFGTREFDLFKVEFKYGSRRFDFSDIEEWAKAKESLKVIEEKYKGAYTANEKGLMSVDEDGEVLTLPRVKYTPDTVVIKQK